MLRAGIAVDVLGEAPAAAPPERCADALSACLRVNEVRGLCVPGSWLCYTTAHSAAQTWQPLGKQPALSLQAFAASSKPHGCAGDVMWLCAHHSNPVVIRIVSFAWALW